MLTLLDAVLLGGDTARCVAKLEQLCGVAAGFRCTAASAGRERGDN